MLNAELQLATRVARDAGKAAMRFYGTATAELKSGGSPVTAADHAANEVILATLGREAAGDAVLSEESRDSRERLSAERVWIIDPLDGTKEFLAQNGEFSIMIGLAVGGAAVLGVVYRPDGDVLYAAAAGMGARIERAGVHAPLELAPESPRSLRLVGSRSHPDALVVHICDSLGITDVRPSGSVGLKCGLIAEGECDLYVHPVPYMSEWDTCAPEVVLREAGGSVTDCRGEPLRYNKPDPKQPDGILAHGPAVDASALGRVIELYARWKERSGEPAGVLRALQEL